MKIGVIGETRYPVLPYGPGGLSRSTHALATGLLARGHEVTLHAQVGSEFAGALLQNPPKPADYDAILDFSHEHVLSHLNPGAPIENLIGDRECLYVPPCAVAETCYMQKCYPGARRVPASVDVDSIPFTEKPGDYLIFMAYMHPFKGVQDAVEVGKKTGIKIVFIGPGGEDQNLPDYRGAITNEVQKWALLGGAMGLLCPYQRDAAPRAPLEAAACGVPTLCHKNDGTREHVAHGVTGFVGMNVWDMVANVWKLYELPRPAIREWVKENHDFGKSLVQHEAILQTIAGGERW